MINLKTSINLKTVTLSAVALETYLDIFTMWPVIIYQGKFTPFLHFSLPRLFVAQLP